jgi:hypothetical protein
MKFSKKFPDRWTVEAYVHEPGSEIGLIGQYWPNPIHHVKLEPNREIDLLLSVKHNVANNMACEPDATFLDFTKCFQTKVKEILVNPNSSFTFCNTCRKINVSMCATISMKHFLEPGKDLPFCNNTESNGCSTQCFSDLIR